METYLLVVHYQLVIYNAHNLDVILHIYVDFTLQIWQRGHSHFIRNSPSPGIIVKKERWITTNHIIYYDVNVSYCPNVLLH